MEVLDSSVGLLTNCEVQALFQRQTQQTYDYEEYKTRMKVLFDKMSATNKFKGKPFSDLSEKDKRKLIEANDAQREIAKRKLLEHACWMRAQVTTNPDNLASPADLADLADPANPADLADPSKPANTSNPR
jgi:hypothetical protein